MAAAVSLRVLSLGAGVQSTTLLLMSLAGEIPAFDAVVFADTGWEPADVYAHLDRLADLAPVARVSTGSLRSDALAAAAGMGGRFASMPVFVDNPDGTGSMLRRQCTYQYKVRPVRRLVRELLAERGETQAQLVMGISLDEAMRMRDSDVRYIRNSYPLVDMRITRSDCVRWLERHGHTVPPKSACVGCPFHDDRRWREIRDADPAAWADAVQVDAAIRRLPRVNGDAYLHRTRRPLPMVDLRTPEDHGQTSLWDAECHGMCGL